jgi:hypothetical protein
MTTEESLMHTAISSRRALRKPQFEMKSESEARSFLDDLRPFSNEAERKTRVVVNEVLRDGQVHTRGELIDVLMRTLPIYLMSRSRLVHILKRRQQVGNWATDTRPVEQDTITGARGLVAKVITDKIRDGKARRIGERGTNWSVQLISADGGNRLVRETRAGGTPMAGPLVKYEAARVALEAATKIDEVKSIHDKAVAMAAYAKQAKDNDMVNWAVEIKVRAERRAGELLKVMPKNVGTKGQLKGKSSGAPKKVGPEDKTPTLEKLGITYNDSSTWQKLAEMPEPVFEQKLIAVKAQGEKLTTKAVLAVKSPVSSTPKEEVDIADDVHDTVQKLVKRWPHKKETLINMLQVAIGNLKKGFS